MVKRANKKTKNRSGRRARKIIVIAAEGDNKTERTYFSEFNRKQREYHIIFAAGKSTDPVRIVNEAIKAATYYEIEPGMGDIILAVLDTDYKKEQQITEARRLAKNNGVVMILSNPCFEIWLLQHFRYSTKSYHSNEDVLSELMNRWPSYRKNIDTFEYIYDRTECAIENAHRLVDYHDSIDPGTDVENRNPSTDVFKIVERLQPKEVVRRD